ncbi:MAG: hypothetical protein Q8Q09_27380 [Deltaproteobacteria bacterium]|nr:hypothetical protein [Deltaproteobacteria bacterium]
MTDLYERLLRPERPRLAAAQKLVENLFDGREAWELFASEGFIPREWVQHEWRTYSLEAPDGTRRAYYPPSVKMAVALAADAANVRAAEEIGRGIAQDIRHPMRIVWRLIRAEAVNAYRDSLLRTFKDNNFTVPPELINTGYMLDPFHTEAIMMLMPEHP